MKAFNVYRHPTKGVEAVKVGFSWPAFFFGLIWMLVKSLWGLAGAWLGAYVVLMLLQAVVEDSGQSGPQALVSLLMVVAYFALWLAPAFKGNAWREANLTRRGYQQIGSVQAETPDGAVALVA